MQVPDLTMQEALETHLKLQTPGLHVSVTPDGALDALSQAEIARLQDANRRELHGLLRRCALAVLNTGSSDAPAVIAERYRAFDLRVASEEHGIRLLLRNAPASAFVDGSIIRGVQEHLFAVLRDLMYADALESTLTDSARITDVVFSMLRNARVMSAPEQPGVVVCWGGHSIPREEYEYSKQVGYELGLRGLDICTGCGPGAMKGPMKGATIGHAKQRCSTGRYVGITEPGIIAAEPPNPLVNRLVVMPDIEKRLEAFVRLGHGVIVFPGGVGTAEEMLYLIGTLLQPQNEDALLPFVMTGPEASRGYFEELHAFIGLTLGERAQSLYRIIIDDPRAVGQYMRRAVAEVRAQRATRNEAFSFNWRLRVPEVMQLPFTPTHEGMRALRLDADAPLHELAADLRRAFSGIVAGNVKPEGQRIVAERGPWEIRGQARLLGALDELLARFTAEGRMKTGPGGYTPCYRLVM